MTNHTKLTIWTIVADSLILIGMGHGIAPIGLIELPALYNVFNKFSLPPTSTYEHSIFAAAIFYLAAR